MFADAGAAGHHRDVDQIQVPKAAQFGLALNGDIEGRPQLDARDIPDGVGVLYVASMEYVIFSAPSISEHRKSKSESVSLLMPPDSWICLTI